MTSMRSTVRQVDQEHSRWTWLGESRPSNDGKNMYGGVIHRAKNGEIRTYRVGNAVIIGGHDEEGL